MSTKQEIQEDIEELIGQMLGDMTVEHLELLYQLVVAIYYRWWIKE